MKESPSSKSFSENLHSVFRMALSEGASLNLELIEVAEQHHSPHLEQFSVIFRGPLTPQCPQRIYKLEHERLGAMELFLAPLGPQNEGMLYQSCFSRFRKEGSLKSG